jgi:hypothetical protein
MRARGLPNPTSRKRIAPNLCRRESGFCGRMVERPRQLAAAETALADGVPGVATVSIIASYGSSCRMSLRPRNGRGRRGRHSLATLDRQQ